MTIGELAINMLHNLIRNIMFDIPAAVPFIGNDHGRSTETGDKSFMLINPAHKTKCSVSKRLISNFHRFPERNPTTIHLPTVAAHRCEVFIVDQPSVRLRGEV